MDRRNFEENAIREMIRNKIHKSGKIQLNFNRFIFPSLHSSYLNSTNHFCITVNKSGLYNLLMSIGIHGYIYLFECTRQTKRLRIDTNHFILLVFFFDLLVDVCLRECERRVISPPQRIEYLLWNAMSSQRWLCLIALNCINQHTNIFYIFLTNNCRTESFRNWFFDILSVSL